METAPNRPKPWNYYSAVTCCPSCEGTGNVSSSRRASTWDPYPEVECPDCDGSEHGPECEVCGFTTVVPGYDCYACETVYGLPDELLTDEVYADLCAAMLQAFGAAKNAAHAAESYIPAGGAA